MKWRCSSKSSDQLTFCYALHKHFSKISKIYEKFMHGTFLIFCKILEGHVGLKLTAMIFFEKISSWFSWSKVGTKWDFSLKMPPLENYFLPWSSPWRVINDFFIWRKNTSFFEMSRFFCFCEDLKIYDVILGIATF